MMRIAVSRTIVKTTTGLFTVSMEASHSGVGYRGTSKTKTEDQAADIKNMMSKKDTEIQATSKRPTILI